MKQFAPTIASSARARKVVRAFDVAVSTCRPTRGAVAVVPIRLHNQIASTGFSIVRPHENVNPFYLHYALRLASTLEQFRKWSTGSSYPAILDSDVAKTLIPVPNTELQDAIAAKMVVAMSKRSEVIRAANNVWAATVSEITASLSKVPVDTKAQEEPENIFDAITIEEVKAILKDLPPISTDKTANGDDEGLFADLI